MNSVLVVFLLLTLNARAAEPRPSEMLHRTLQLSRLMNPSPRLDDVVAPDFSLEFEVIEHWADAHPAQLIEYVELIKKYRTNLRAYERLRQTGAAEKDIYANIDEGKSIWDQVSRLPTEAPWDSLDWSRVFAREIANLEVNLANELRLDLARVQMFTEHTLPHHQGFCGEESLILALETMDPERSKPLYCDKLVAELIARADKISKVLAFTLRNANPESYDRRAMVKTILGVLYKQNASLREIKYDGSRLMRLRKRTEALDPSVRRDAILTGIRDCEVELGLNQGRG